jgi:hypothetical protein
MTKKEIPIPATAYIGTEKSGFFQAIEIKNTPTPMV